MAMCWVGAILRNIMDNKQEILKKRFDKLEKPYEALKAYKQLIDKMTEQSDIFNLLILMRLKLKIKQF